MKNRIINHYKTVTRFYFNVQRSVRGFPGKFSCIAGIMLLGISMQPLNAATTTQITKNGIIWNFSQAVEYGQFVNGDYWVVGPVRVTSVSPGWDGERHGSMLNPVVASGVQGYRSGINYPFSAGARAVFPLDIDTYPSSLVSTVGLTTPLSGGSASGVDLATVLTVLEDVPPAGSFRPPYVAGSKPMWNTSAIDYSKVPLLNLPAGASFPDMSHVFKEVWLQGALRGDQGSSIIPNGNVPAYPQLGAQQVSDLSLALMIDTPNRTEYIHRMVQLGIDLYHIHIDNGDAWRAFGGFGNGRKWPILFAGILLDDAAMKYPQKTTPGVHSLTGTVDKFGEDGHTTIGLPLLPEFPEGRPLFGQDCVAGAYEAELADPDGNPGPRDCRDPEGIEHGASYRVCCTSVSWVGYALAARLMNATDLWNHRAFFDYMDWWVEMDENHNSTFHSPFVGDMWYAYREGLPPLGSSDYVIYQAEDFSAASGCVEADNWSGYTGDGFADFGGNGTWAEWNHIFTAIGGQTTLKFRYANLSSYNRQCALQVNGVNVGNIAFSTTTQWTNWLEVTANVTLIAGNNTIRLTANTSGGGPNLDKIEMAVIRDTQPPTVPTGLAASGVMATTVDLDWNASTDNVAVVGYKIYTNGADPMVVSAATTGVTVAELSPQTSYSFTVSARDAANNESVQSSSVNVTTQGGGGGSSVTYEGEDFTSASGTSVATNWGGYLGAGFADFGGNNTWAEWNNINLVSGGLAELKFRYANGSSNNRQCALVVNGVSIGNVAFAPTGHWETWQVVTIEATLLAGNNTIRLTANTTSGGPNLDQIEVAVAGPQIYQAEDFSAVSGCTEAVNWGGYTGASFVDFGGNGSWTEWNNITAGSGGQVTLKFVHANGSANNRQCVLHVNGINVGNVAFAPTGHWENWLAVPINVTLSAGNNTIRLTANTASGGPNLDRVEVE